MTIDRWITLVLAVVSWFVARYYYRRSEKKRVPTFILHSMRALAEPGLCGVGDFALSYRGAEVGRNGITEAKVNFWNSGQLPILEDEVLETYTISTPVRILTHSVLKASRDVVNLRPALNESQTALALHFAVLEPGDGATLRFVFDGPRNTKIEFNGACLESRKPLVLSPDPIYSLPLVKRFNETYGTMIFPMMVPLVGGLLVWLFVWATSKFFGQRVLNILETVGVGFVVLVIALSVIMACWYQFTRLRAPYLPPDVKD